MELEVFILIGDNIKFYRKKNQLTQDDIAEACNVTRQAVSKWENGESLPTVDNLYALSRLLHTSVDDILIGEKERDDEPSLSFFFYIFLWFSCPSESPFYILNFLICGRNRCVINHYGKTVNGCFFRY
ncbi:XRE family transcriptional regulator [Agathobacter rectalis]|uniref:XRE family transcriptional regulator n=1 Tax=Agathobacter rectalis TaxID=39491 RepID=A0A413U7D2_9FIRM|nr:XRE family transcriptional regulator [Agathobacter rectalis]RHA93788.1 XRE family transcriptional regulator [Agathobacter rectalis]RHB07388.1 XRE family transcriptional regulator [Agathobacter rectalis]